MPDSPKTILALDVGERRVGVARASTIARLSAPLKTLEHNESFLDDLLLLIKQEAADALVVGLPRSLDGQDTAQTSYVRDFVAQLQQNLDLPIHVQDEALTSVKAEKELVASGKPYQKADIDALAATYILEDYLTEHPPASGV